MNKLLSIGLCDMESVKDNAPTTVAENPTFNDGKGIKDTIVMTGPLSNIFTQALNIYFKKTPLTVEPVAPIETDSHMVATESILIDTVVSAMTAMNAEENKDNVTKEPDSDFSFVDSSDDFENKPKAIIYATTADASMSMDGIEIIEAEYERYENADKDWILYIDTDSYGKSELKGGEVNLDDLKNYKTVDNAFKASTESFFQNRGIPVVVGFENLKLWLAGSR